MGTSPHSQGVRRERVPQVREAAAGVQTAMQVNRGRGSSIEFVVDEAAGVLLGYERTGADSPSRSVEEILRLDLSDLRKREPGELQRSIGRLVLAFLNSRSSKGLGLPKDEEDERRLDEQQLASLEGDADSGDPQAIYDLATSLIGQGISKDSWSDIERGERLLDQAADGGLGDAVKYRDEVWS